MIRNKRLLKAISLFLLLELSLQILFPTVSYALTSGPSQPEFSSFEPVATTNMVDEFTGDFTYNLPVLEVPGPQGSSYPISLSYHSGVTPEEEASWVGYGWSLNPGAINRNTRGIPDDFDGDAGAAIKFHNRMPKNWTANVGGGVGLEITSYDASIGANMGVRYNNYRGFGYTKGIGLTVLKGAVSLGYGVSDGKGSFSLQLNPSAASSYAKEGSKKTINKEEHKRKINTNLKYQVEVKGKVKTKNLTSIKNFDLVGGSYGIFSYAENSKPASASEFNGKSYNVSLGIQLDPAFFPVGVTANMVGSYSFQKNVTDEPPVPAYGYLFSSKASGSGNKLMDYHVEKETDYNKRDVFLGVPFNDADNFAVTGEGLSGGFRLHNKTIGHFGPRAVQSTTTIFNTSVEVSLGLTFGVGTDLGAGQNVLTVGDWKKDFPAFEAFDNTAKDEPVFFRFNNDMGGEWGKNFPDDKPLQAGMSSENSLSNNKTPLLDNSLFDINQGERSGRSSYIGYTLNGDMVGTNPYKSYNKIYRLNNSDDRNQNKTLIGEIAVTNESGNQYLYSLPVYGSDEKQISYSLERSQISKVAGSESGFEDNEIVYYKINNNLDASAQIKVGQEQANKYATSYLLTEIRTPDYLDRTNDGPTSDDLGGYTRFNYIRHADNYVWRAPYRGLKYDKNSHSDPKDDLGSFSSGVKEIYYLNSIETKTHVAIFRFRDEARIDSKSAPDGTTPQNDPLVSTSQSNVELKALDRIDLYLKSDCSFNETDGTYNNNSNTLPIKTVRFKYDNSLCKEVPNGDGVGGKLTLTKVYFEYNGISKAKISPYEFEYSYPVSSANFDYPTRYSQFLSEYVGLTPADQNPPYSVLNADPWGNYWSNGKNRSDNLREWIDQGMIPNTNHFDPAAWHLKQISLPSGGEIHVQYEQDDYNYVQDQEAHIMASISRSISDTEYVIDSKSIGFMPTATREEKKKILQEMANMIKTRYATGKKKMYFKFFYSLTGFAGAPDLNSCNAEFITGYTALTTARVDSNSDSDELVIVLGGDRLPKTVCQDFVKANRLGMVYSGSDCGGTSGMDFDDAPDTKDIAVSAVRALLSTAVHIKADPPDLCYGLNLNYSYLRIPVQLPKKGGGTRVKRLLMYDRGIENTSTSFDKDLAVLYGNEYHYTTDRNGFAISSGVATNEPAAIREENILVDDIQRHSQSTWSRIVAGDDLKQSEGPLGESILPAAGVGYSKITVTSIHTGKTNPGFSVTEFYTAKDYPISLASPYNSGSMTSIKKGTPETLQLPTGLINIVVDKYWATQGFSFVLNSMHGQIKRSASYGGSTDNPIEVASRSYEYFQPSEKVPMMSEFGGGITMMNPGREVDMTFAQKEIVEKTRDLNIEVDVDIAVVIPIVMVYVTGAPSINSVDGAMRTHATTKVVRYPAILKKVTSSQDGISHTEEYLAFDEYTGKPVASRSNDEFKNNDKTTVNEHSSSGAYLTQQIPASWQYKSMAPKWTTEGTRISTSFTFDGTYVSVLSNDCGDFALFTEGDKIELGAAGALYHVLEVDKINSKLKVVQSSDAKGPSGTGAYITIFRTGRTNQLHQQAGSITQYSRDYNQASPSGINQANRYEIDNFSAAVKNATNGISGTGTLQILSGPFTHMDISGFADKLTDCAVDLTDAEISQVEFTYNVIGTQLNLQLMSFKVKCGTGNTPADYSTVKAEGWGN